MPFKGVSACLANLHSGVCVIGFDLLDQGQFAARATVDLIRSTGY